jgi:hypothetical protein
VQYSSICGAICVTVRDLVVLWHTCEQKTRSKLANRNQTQNTLYNFSSWHFNDLALQLTLAEFNYTPSHDVLHYQVAN